MGFLNLNGLEHYKGLTYDKMCDNIAPAFSASQTYAVDDYVMHGGVLYRCICAVTAPGPWNAGNWVKYRIMTGPSYPVYGVEWDYSQASPALTRTDDAVGFPAPVPATSLDGSGSSPFDSVMPWAGMKRTRQTPPPS